VRRYNAGLPSTSASPSRIADITNCSGVMAKAYRRAGFLRLELKDWQVARANFTKAIPVLEQVGS